MDWIKFIKNGAHLTLDFSNAVYSNKLPLDCAVAAIDKIVSKYPPPYTLFSSGGIDSQAMIYSWIKSGHKFNVVSVRYENSFNSHDLETLGVFAYIYSLDIEYKDFEILPFLDRLHEYTIPYSCTSPQICTHMAISELVKDGTVIFSGNPILSMIPLNQTILGLKRYSDLSRPDSMIPFFFMHDPELSVSFMPYETEMHKQNTAAGPLSIPAYYRKFLIYKMAGFDIIPQSQKLTGFEKIKDYFDNQKHLVSNQERIEFSSKPSKRVFDQIYRYRWEKIIKYQDVLTFVY